MKRTFINFSRGAAGSAWAFSLVELIGVLAIIAILAAVLLPALIKQTDKLVTDQEISTLQSFGTAIQNNVLRTRTIPDNTTWISVVTNQLGMNNGLVSTNTRGRYRVFVIDTNGFSPIVLPYSQTSTGIFPRPPQARFMIVSSLSPATDLPSGLVSRPGQSIFNDVWNTPPRSLPTNAIWAGWNKGRADDLIIQRINLSPSFVHLILATNNSTANYASYSVDSGAIITNTLSGGTSDAYFFQSAVLNLYSNAVLDSQQTLQGDVSFVYDQNVWRNSILSVSTVQTNPPDFSGILNAFVNAGIPAYATVSSNAMPINIANDFINYMNAYIGWSSASFPSTGASRTTALNAYNTMMNDVNSLVNSIQP